MSADNWAICPSCVAVAEADAKAARLAVEDVYGKVSAEEYIARTQALKEVDPEAHRTLREDYETYTEEGYMKVHYRVACTTCNLAGEMNESKLFWTPPSGRNEESP